MLHSDELVTTPPSRRAARVVNGICVGTVRAPASGLIEALKLEDGRHVEGDIFVDCSGYRRLLIGRELDSGWRSYVKELPVNRAMPFFLPYQEDGEIGPYTIAWARENGWVWQIPTQARMGCGYVYCDAFISPEDARAGSRRRSAGRSSRAPTFGRIVWPLAWRRGFSSRWRATSIMRPWCS